jgi:hypothetical protein
MIKDGSWIDDGSAVAALGDVSAVAVSMNRKLVVEAGPSELTEVASVPPSCVASLGEAGGGGGVSPSPSPGTVRAVHQIELSGL